MHRRPPLARLADTLPQGLCRQAVGLVRPLAAVVVLAVGAGLFSIGASLLGDRGGAAIGHVMAGPTRAVELQPLAMWAGSTPPADAIGKAAPERAWAELEPRGLADGAFGVTFAAAEGTPQAGWRPTVMVDAELPPLRVEIMGMGYVPHRARGSGNALVRAP
jgi:hypothetical protein